MSRHRSSSLVAHPARAIILVLALLAGSTPAGMGRPAAANDAPAGGGSAATGFTYQGELRQGGAAASGSFAMSFTLWSAETGGTQLGGPLSFPSVDVTDGRFTVELDFGVDAVRGGPAWLEVTVEGFTLSPRQAVTPAPFSMTTRGIDVDGAGRVGIGTEASDQARLTVAGDGAAPVVRAATDAGSVVELAGPSTALRSVAATPTGWAAILDGWSQLGDRAFVGREDFITSAEYFGVLAPVATGYGGMYVATEGASGWPFYGYATGGVARAWTRYDESSNRWSVFIGGLPRVEVTPTRVRGPDGITMPIAAARVNDAGVILTGGYGIESIEAIDDATGRWYRVTLSVFGSGAPIASVTPTGGAGGAVSATCSSAPGGLILGVRLRDVAGESVPGGFSIVVWPGD